MHKCEFCQTTLKTLSSLNYHKKNNKTCLKKQSMDNDNIISSLVECEFCKKSYSSNNINNHLKICKEKNKIEDNKLMEELRKLRNFYEINKNLKQEFEILKKENKKLEKEIENLKLENNTLKTENNIFKNDRKIVNKMAQEPKTTNNIINNLSVYDDNIISDRFNNALNNIKASDIYDGQQSIGRIIAPCLKNDDGTKLLTCSDFSRGVFIKKDENGNIEKDIKCRNLVEIIEPIASAKADELIKNDYMKRDKLHKLKLYEEQIKNHRNEIENIEMLLIGFKINSEQWIHYKNMITTKQNQINDLKYLYLKIQSC
jgi:hypothetical protein